MRAIETSAIITGIRAKVDRSLSFTACTPELDNIEKVAFMELQGINLKMVITPTDTPNVPEMKVKSDIEQKTPSQRLRGVLFLLWDRGKKDTEFETFYKDNMEKFIDLIKGKLE